MKLGRLPNQGRPRLKLTSALIPATAYNPPPSCDYYSKVPAASWGMDGNDAYGDCTCAEVDHTTKARQVAAGNPEVRSTEAEVLALYSAITGFDPKRPNTDQGAEMQAVREYWLNVGATLGGKTHKLLMFAEVERQDHLLVKWCIDRFGALGVGINFPSSAMDQFNAGKPWDVVKGSQIEGGHAIAAVGYDDRYVYIVTWGKVQPMTWAFYDAFTEEVWADLDDSFVSSVSGSDPLGETLYALGQQFEQVTGKPNPVPTPPPQPAPTPSPSGSLPADVLAWGAKAVKQAWRSKEDRHVAQELLDLAGQ